MIFRLRRGAQKLNHHDSDTEDPTGAAGTSYDAATSAGKIPRRKRSTRRVFFPIQHTTRSDTLFILLVTMMGCILTGCTILVSLKIYASFSSSHNSSNNRAYYSRHSNLRDDMVHGYGNRDGFDEQDQRLDRHARARRLARRPKPPPNGRYYSNNYLDEEEDEFEELPFNPIYRIPDASTTVGDRSDWYAKLRKEMDPILTVDKQRSLQRVQELQRFDEHNVLVGSQAHAIMDHSDGGQQQQHSSDHQQILYDIYNCPKEPPPDYPYQWKLVDQLLADWPADQLQVPKKIYNGLCIFDYTKDYDKALRYRNAEQPFIVINDPNVARTVERWAIPGYMQEMLGNAKHRAEHNTNGHFMYHQPPPPPRGRERTRARQERRRTGRRERRAGSRDEPEGLQDLYGRPAKLQRADVMPEALRMTYKEWLEKANTTDPSGLDDDHWYFRLIGCGYMGADGSCDAGSSEYLFDEMPYFQPQNDNSIYLGEGNKQKGIHCRFGMPGVIAENHFDGSRNSIAVLRGSRRYILSHPDQCENLTILPQGHPSARHSAVDYTNPDLETFPEFADALANEVVLQAGQVLYLPTNWFHFIVSLELNMQCNTRSGITGHYPLDRCGF